MKSKSLILMVVSLGFGLVAAVGISQVMGRSGENQAKISMGPVLVSITPLDHNEELDETNVKIENWPLNIIPEDAATSLEQIENTAIVTRLSKGLPILVTDLINKNEVKHLAIPKGFKVVALPVAADDTIAGLLTPGDKVDVIGIFKVRRKNETKTISKTFLKAITVFSVGNQIRHDAAREGSGGSSIVGVLLNEKQSEQIFLVQKEAQLKLVLRGDDANDEDSSMDGLVGIGGIWGDDPDANEDENQADSQEDNTSWTTRIWNGNSVETYRYNGEGDLPEMENLQTIGTPISAPATAPADYEENDSSSESARDLEEDQYPGE